MTRAITQQDLIFAGLPSALAGLGVVQQLGRLAIPTRFMQRQVMASPPTLTLSTAHTISSPKTWEAVHNYPNAASPVLNPLFRYRRTSLPVMAGANAPDSLMVRGSGSNYGSTIGQNQNVLGAAYLTDGNGIEFTCKGINANLWIKIDGQYVSLTPMTTASDGGVYYLYVPLDSKLHEVEIIGDSQYRHGNIYTPPTATLSPVAPRGPTCMIMADSFGEPTGASSAIMGYTQVLADGLGWDDVRPSAVGGTGMCNPASGGKLAWPQRVATDIIPVQPDMLIIQGSINDIAAYTPAQVVAACTSIISQVQSGSPRTFIIMTSVMSNSGGGLFSANAYNVSAALKALAASYSIPFVDLLELPTPSWSVPVPITITSAVTAGASKNIQVSNILPVGTTAKFADGSHVVVTASTGSPVQITVDYLGTAQAAGAVLTPCGNSIWQGGGHVGATTGVGNCDLVVGTDGTHPTDLGHNMIGTALATGIMNVLRGSTL